MFKVFGDHEIPICPFKIIFHYGFSANKKKDKLYIYFIYKLKKNKLKNKSKNKLKNKLKIKR